MRWCWCHKVDMRQISWWTDRREGRNSFSWKVGFRAVGYLKPFSSQFFASLHLSYLKRSPHMQVEGMDLLMVPRGLVERQDMACGGAWRPQVQAPLPPVYQVAPGHTHCPRESPCGTLDRKHQFRGRDSWEHHALVVCRVLWFLPALLVCRFLCLWRSSETGAVLGKAAVGILGACLSSCWSHGKSAGCSLPGLLPAEYGLRSVRWDLELCPGLLPGRHGSTWLPRSEALWRKVMHDDCRSFTSPAEPVSLGPVWIDALTLATASPREGTRGTTWLSVEELVREGGA